MDSCKKNIPESNNMWYNAWKQTLYHRASGFCVHRRKPGAQFPRRDTMAHLVFAFTAKIQVLKSPGGVPCPEDMV